MSIVDGQPVNSSASNAAFVSRTASQSIGGVKTFTDVTDSSSKDTGSVVLEGGLGVEKKIHSGTDITADNDIIAGGDMSATGTVTGSNLSGTNTGDVTLAAVGSTPSLQGASLSGQVLTLQPANVANPGVVSTAAQTFAGDKTFNDNIIVGGNLTVNGTQTIVNSTDLQVVDKNILVNKNGNDASADGSGLDIQRTSDNGAIRYDSALPSKWKLGNISALYEVIVSGVAQSITGVKTFLSGIDLNSQKITNLLSPTGLLDGANKTYVDSFGGAAFLATSGGTTTLTVTSNRDIIPFGTSTHTYVLPSTSLLQVGNWWRFTNRSTMSVTIQNASLGTVVVLASQTWANIRVIATGTETFATNVSPIYSSTDGSLNFAGFKGVNLATPTTSTDAATKGYVDGISVGEANTASNVGTGSGVYRSKTGVNLDLRSINSNDGKLSITQNADDITINATNIAISSYTPTSSFATGVPAASIKEILVANVLRVGNRVTVKGAAYFRNDGSTVNFTWSVPITNGNNIVTVSGVMRRSNSSGESAAALSRLNAIASDVTPSTHIKFNNTGINTTGSDAFWEYEFYYDLA